MGPLKAAAVQRRHAETGTHSGCMPTPTGCGRRRSLHAPDQRTNAQIEPSRRSDNRDNSRAQTQPSIAVHTAAETRVPDPSEVENVTGSLAWRPGLRVASRGVEFAPGRKNSLQRVQRPFWMPSTNVLSKAPTDRSRSARARPRNADSRSHVDAFSVIVSNGCPNQGAIVSVPGSGGDSARHGSTWGCGGGHRPYRLRWSCETSTMTVRGSDDRREIGAF